MDPIGKRRNTCAVVLAGGRSRRMGRDKALLEIAGRTLIEIVAFLARPLVDQVFISTNNPYSYQFLGLPLVPDIFPYQGPLAGIHAVMAQSDYAKYLALACDLPNLKIELLRLTIDWCEDCDAVIPRSSDGRIHPLCGCYRRSCLAAIERNLRSGNNKVADLLADPSLGIQWLEASEKTFHDSDLNNINDVNALEEIYKALRLKTEG